MKERSFEMNLTPSGLMSKVLMDGQDISHMLRGVKVDSSVDGLTTVVTLCPARGCSAKLSVLLPEAKIVIEKEPK